MKKQKPPFTSTPILRVLQSKDETKGFYNKIARFYDLMAERSEGPICRMGLRMLAAKPGERVLEIGFGTGHALVELAKAVGPTGKVHGMDLSDQMVKIARGRLSKANLAKRCQLTSGDAAKLPYADESMDAVFMSFTLELFDTPEIPTVLAECKRVLKPGGRLGVIGMSKDGPDEPLIEVFQWTHKHFPNYLDCRPIYVKQAIERADFEIHKMLRKHMWIPVEIVLGIKGG
jgi:demethylmenaquinone methyltransferase/2-methoxy-6-polyprenyl-1,4-benzoquinol methylase